ncbi:MAG TPA: hypothetical protein VGE98_04880, partial [Thermoanaerobaculia bacterium]
MSGPRESEIVRRLRETDGREEPPPDLLARLKADLPPAVPVHPAVVREVHPPPLPWRRRILLAASLLV